MEYRARIYYDDYELACASDTGTSKTEVVLDGLSIQWGRESLIDDTQPTQLTYRLINTTDWYANQIRDGRLNGRSVTVVAERADGSGEIAVMFRGFIHDASARRRRDLNLEGTSIEAWEITINAVDPTAYLANVDGIEPLVGIGGFTSPGGDLGSRRLDLEWYVKDNVPGISGVGPLSGWDKSSPTGPGPDGSLDEQVKGFYSSDGNSTYCYNPESGWINHVGHPYGSVRPRLALESNRIVIYPTTRYAGYFVPGNSVIVDEDMEIETTPEAAINYLSSVYPVEWDGLGDKPRPTLITWEYYYDQRSSTQPPRRLEYYTMFADKNQLEFQADRLWKVLKSTGSRPSHPDIRFTGHDLPNWIRNRLFTTIEGRLSVFISGDRAHQWIESGNNPPSPPVYTPIGGSITFTHQHGWDISWTLRHYAAENTYTPVDWFGVGQPGPRPIWHGSSSDEDLYPIDDTITWYDMSAVDRSWNGAQR